MTQQAGHTGRSSWLAAGIVAAILVGIVGVAWSGRDPHRSEVASGSRTPGRADAIAASPPATVLPGATRDPEQDEPALPEGGTHAVLTFEGGGRTELTLRGGPNEISAVASLPRQRTPRKATLRLSLSRPAGSPVLLHRATVTLPPSVPHPPMWGCVMLVRDPVVASEVAAPDGTTRSIRYRYTAAVVSFRDSSVLSVRLIRAAPLWIGLESPAPASDVCI